MATQTARSDTSGAVSWIPVLKVEKVAADTALSSDYLAVKPQRDVGAYYSDDPDTVFTILSQEVFAIAEGKTLKLTKETVCLIY